MLGKLTKMVVEGVLEGEMDDYLGYGKGDPAGRDGGNSRNGHRAHVIARPGRCSFRGCGTVIPVSSRKSSPRDSGGSPESTTW